MDEKITVEYFCKELTLKDKRYELINAFYRTQKLDGFLIDSEANFNRAFIAFTQKTAGNY